MWEMSTIERRYSVPPSTLSDPSGRYRTTEDLHAWSIYRQNLNSDFTDSALGTGDKSQPPFGNFRLRDSTVQTILNHPKYGPRERNSELGSNVFTYLRFGLPRVFPQGQARGQAAKGAKNGSSGYDSSDDGSPYMNNRRTRSDPDFRNHIIEGNGVAAALANGSSNTAAAAVVATDRARRLKASSEADLLSADSRLNRRHVLKSRENGGFHQSENDALIITDRKSQFGGAGSQMSVNSRASKLAPQLMLHGANKQEGFCCYDAPIMNERFFPKDSLYSTFPGADGESTTGAGGAAAAVRYPHFQVRELSYEVDMSSAWHTLCGGARTKLRMLENLSFEVKGGEILAVMATTDTEGTALLDILANRHRKWRCRLRGEFIINGLFLNLKKLQNCVAYVQRHTDFTPDMSVRQTLLFTSLLQEPGNNNSGFDAKSRINALLEDLGLGQVKHTRVCDLTESEKRRLNVACQLFLDTDIILLDQPTKGMDIFDTFFLVEYLRKWATRGRIVILTIHPPTYEIFTMVTRVAVISTGRMLYFGKRRDMLPYFAYIDFPCPAYKNPSDYYLDLVTLDNLSAEAMLESSQRVENLVEIFRRRQEPLQDPGPPGIPPSIIKRANFLSQILVLWIRAMIYTFPFNVVKFCGRVFVAALMSVCVGAVYWNVRAGREQEHVEDRYGFYYVMTALAVWPILLIDLSSVWKEKETVARDIREKLYHKLVYLLCKLSYSLLPAAAVVLAFCVPAYSMAGLQTTSRVKPFGNYIGYMLLYLLSIRMMAMACSWACHSKHNAAFCCGLILTVISLTCGHTIHFKDLSIVFSWAQWISPLRWVYEQLVQNEFTSSLNDEEIVKYSCSRNPVIKQDNSILTRAECGIVTNAHALMYHGFQRMWFTYQPLIAVIIFHLVCLVFGLLAFLTRKLVKNKEEKET